MHACILALVSLAPPRNHMPVQVLRGMTKGRAQYSMQLERYEVVPPNIQQEIVAKNKVAA